MDNYNFGPNVIYFALGITEGRPAGRPAGPFGPINLFFEVKKRPAGTFWAGQIRRPIGVY